ncbi:MAG: UbiA family prenyltransferase [Bacteroidota bacterium]|nr:UbiA family prenyltransferase [Bacteroidota bacterium]
MLSKFSPKAVIHIFDKDTISHLRIPFSVYLFPIYLFSLSMAKNINWASAIIIFICLHLFIYPGSNSYNSYMDKDEGSIGGLKKPPPATRKIYFASIIFDIFGLLLSLFIGFDLFLAVLIYITVSKLYSWDKSRLKKYGILSWMVVLIFQGGYTYFLVNYFSSPGNQGWFNNYNISAMLIASLFVGAYYPLSQIYQHKEDIKRGDKTISSMLGIKGTFILSFLLFAGVNILLLLFFISFYNIFYYFLFFLFLSPVATYFIKWMNDSIKDSRNANYDRTMKMNTISAFCMSACFLIMMIASNL